MNSLFWKKNSFVPIVKARAMSILFDYISLHVLRERYFLQSDWSLCYRWFNMIPPSKFLVDTLAPIMYFFAFTANFFHLMKFYISSKIFGHRLNWVLWIMVIMDKSCRIREYKKCIFNEKIQWLFKCKGQDSFQINTWWNQPGKHKSLFFIL